MVIFVLGGMVLVDSTIANKNYVDSKVASSRGGINNYNDLLSGSLAGYCKYNYNYQNGDIFISPVISLGVQIGSNCGCQSGWKVIEMDNGYVANSKIYTCIKN